MRVRNALFSIIALAAVGVPDLALGQDRSTFTVDGDPKEWGGLRIDESFDVVPDTNSAVDLGGFSFCGGCLFYPNEIAVVEDAPDTLFAFLFTFIAPPFRGPEETTVEIFFDVSHSDSYGEAQGPWVDFRPDYVVGGHRQQRRPDQGVLLALHRQRVDKKEGADIPELDVALGGRWLEGALDWKLLDVPDTDVPYYELEGDFNSAKGVRVSKGEYRDYLPNGDQPLVEKIHPSHESTAVEPDTWGEIKSP